MDQKKVTQVVEALNGLTARNALCLLVGCILTVLDEAPRDEERQQSLDGCIDLLKRAGRKHHLSPKSELQSTRTDAKIEHLCRHCP